MISNTSESTMPIPFTLNGQGEQEYKNPDIRIQTLFHNSIPQIPSMQFNQTNGHIQFKIPCTPLQPLECDETDATLAQNQTNVASDFLNFTNLSSTIDLPSYFTSQPESAQAPIIEMDELAWLLNITSEDFFEQPKSKEDPTTENPKNTVLLSNTDAEEGADPKATRIDDITVELNSKKRAKNVTPKRKKSSTNAGVPSLDSFKYKASKAQETIIFALCSEVLDPDTSSILPKRYWHSQTPFVTEQLKCQASFLSRTYKILTDKPWPSKAYDPSLEKFSFEAMIETENVILGCVNSYLNSKGLNTPQLSQINKEIDFNDIFSSVERVEIDRLTQVDIIIVKLFHDTNIHPDNNNEDEPKKIYELLPNLAVKIINRNLNKKDALTESQLIDIWKKLTNRLNWAANILEHFKNKKTNKYTSGYSNPYKRTRALIISSFNNIFRDLYSKINNK